MRNMQFLITYKYLKNIYWKFYQQRTPRVPETFYYFFSSDEIKKIVENQCFCIYFTTDFVKKMIKEILW
jgi:hypothetical protein